MVCSPTACQLRPSWLYRARSLSPFRSMRRYVASLKKGAAVGIGFVSMYLPSLNHSKRGGKQINSPLGVIHELRSRRMKFFSFSQINKPAPLKAKLVDTVETLPGSSGQETFTI